MTDNPEKQNKGCTQDRDRALSEIVEALDAWTDQFGEPYITVSVPPAAYLMHLPLGGKRARAWITKMLLEKGRRTGSKRTMEEIVHLLEAKALTEGKSHYVYTRIAGHNGVVYINLMDETGRVIKVDAAGVSIIANPPVRFTTPKDGKPLPEPDLTGTLEDFDRLLNVENIQDRHLIVSWMLNAMFPQGPYPILVVSGEQGSAKSTTSKLIRWLIDPRTPLTETLQSNDRNLMVTADQAHVLCYDNLSSLTHSQSDAFCRLATGGGYKTRQNYSDKEPVLFDAMRPMIFNGIENVAQQLDLLNRCIIITLPTITDERRMDEEPFWKLAEELRPKILGALCNLLSAALKNLPHTRPKKLPRMADFARRVMSVETLIGWNPGEFLEFYSAISSAATITALEGDPVLGPVLKLMDGKPEWSGTPTQLRTEIVNRTPLPERRFIPKVNKLPLKRIKPGLLTFGIELDLGRSSQQRTVVLRNNNLDFRVPINAEPERAPIPVEVLLNRKVADTE